MRVPVCASDHRIIELAEPERVTRLAKAANAEVVRQRKTGKVVRIILKSHGDDHDQVSHRGDPRKYSHDHETEHESRADSNPPRCWTLRQLPNHAADIFGAVVNDCMKKAT